MNKWPSNQHYDIKHFSHINGLKEERFRKSLIEWPSLITLELLHRRMRWTAKFDTTCQSRGRCPTDRYGFTHRLLNLFSKSTKNTLTNEYIVTLSEDSHKKLGKEANFCKLIGFSDVLHVGNTIYQRKRKVTHKLDVMPALTQSSVETTLTYFK